MLEADGGCGSLGQACCCSGSWGDVTGPTCCGESLWCHFFNPGPDATSSSANPSLCLAVPEGCGAAGKACCPDKNGGYNDKACTEPNALCNGQDAGDAEYAYYLQYSADPRSVVPGAYGTCQLFPQDRCGAPGGPCSPGYGNQTCPEGKQKCEGAPG